MRLNTQDGVKQLRSIYLSKVLWLSQREGTWTLEKWDAWTAGPCFCSHFLALGCWEHHPRSLPRKKHHFAVSDFRPAVGREHTRCTALAGERR